MLNHERNASHSGHSSIGLLNIVSSSNIRISKSPEPSKPLSCNAHSAAQLKSGVQGTVLCQSFQNLLHRFGRGLFGHGADSKYDFIGYQGRGHPATIRTVINLSTLSQQLLSDCNALSCSQPAHTPNAGGIYDSLRGSLLWVPRAGC